MKILIDSYYVVAVEQKYLSKLNKIFEQFHLAVGVKKQRQEYLEMASQGDSKQQERRPKSTSFQEDSLSTKIKQFFSPTHLPPGPGSPPVPPVQYKSHHQSSVQPVNRRKVVSAIIPSETKNLSPTSLHPLNRRPSPRPSPGSSPRPSPGSSPRPSPSSSPRPPRPPRPPPYKSASPGLSNFTSPSPPSIPARSTISKKCDFKNDTGIYVCPISPVNGGSSGARRISSSQSPIKKEAVNNLPPFGQKASPAPMVMASQQDKMLVKKGNSVSQLNEHGIPVKLHNTDATSTGTTKGDLVPLDDPVYEFAEEDEDGYEYVKVDNSASGDGYLKILKSSSADDVKDDNPDDEYDYEYVAVDNFLRETKNDGRNKEGAGTSKDDYENILHYRQLSV